MPLSALVKTYLPTFKTHVVNLKRDAKDLSRDLQRLEVRGKLESKTLLYNLPPLDTRKGQYVHHITLSVLSSTAFHPI